MKNLTRNRLVLVTGGAASGKSALAEDICCGIPGPKVYIAAMQPFGDEAEARIQRHREMRADKGFATVERYRDLESLTLAERYAAALLEDLGNLVANQMFGSITRADLVAETVTAGLRQVMSQVDTLVVVHNEVFGGAEEYDGDMTIYLEQLSLVARWAAEQADTVIESVCGLPLAVKGGPL